MGCSLPYPRLPVGKTPGKTGDTIDHFVRVPGLPSHHAMFEVAVPDLAPPTPNPKGFHPPAQRCLARVPGGEATLSSARCGARLT